MAIELARQWYVAWRAERWTPTSRPPATTCRRSGTVMCRSIRALSSGWSFEGNHQAAMWGSFRAMASVRLATQLLSPPHDTRPG